MGAFEYCMGLIVGDANGDGDINAEDIIYLINYLFRGGPPPYIMAAGDANGDGEVNAGDIVYLIQYLFHGGPPPGQRGSDVERFLARTALNRAPVRLWLSKEAVPPAEGGTNIIIRASFGTDIAAVQLAIEYDAEELTLAPTLPPDLQALQIYHSQKGGLLKVGVLDLRGENWIPGGEKVDLLVLQANGTNLSSLKIKEAILVDREAYVLPVKIVTEEEVAEQRPQTFSLSENYPNPFNAQTQINYALPKDCNVKVTIYNLLGQRVRVLVDEHQSAGYKTVHWDGKDERGVEVASGVYFYRIQAEDFVQTKKMLLLK